MHYKIGWFGEPGGKSWESSATHVVFGSNTPLCGSRISPLKEFQICSGDINLWKINTYVECRKCKKIAIKRLSNAKYTQLR